jgi:GH15 family glucan-1,4-alpha-glucosidase
MASTKRTSARSAAPTLSDEQPLSAAGERRDGYLPIGAYAAIGDGCTAGLVGSDGAIDWLCVPHLDDQPVFASLLDAPSGGRFVLVPAANFAIERRYLPRSNVLETTFHTADGAVRVTDALTIGAGGLGLSPELVRRVEGLAGRVRMRWVFEPRLSFGSSRVGLHRAGASVLAQGASLQMALGMWDVGDPVVEHGTAAAEFEIQDGGSALLVLEAADSQTLTMPSRDRAERRLRETVEVWSARMQGHSYDGPWRDAVERSLLAISLLTDGRTGAIAAAATSSLPETLGGERNFDYRFGWVRDASFALDALLRIDVQEPTGAAMDWLLRATRRTHPRVDPVYTLGGEVLRSQSSLDLTGYRGSRPVNVGNQAGAQLQLGGFGDLMEAVWNYVSRGHLLAPDAGERIADFADLLCVIWRQDDAGLWELGKRADYASSKIGCWTAFRRAVELAEEGHIPARHLERWRTQRDAVRSHVEDRLFSSRRGSYLMKADATAVDCATLLAARRGFVDPEHTRLEGTIDAILEELHAGGPLLYRYSGMQNSENAFLACSFWMVEALAAVGRLDEAAEFMEGTAGLANDVGLYSEEIVPQTGELRGNFPQALSHLALISAAATLSERTASSQ